MSDYYSPKKALDARLSLSSQSSNDEGYQPKRHLSSQSSYDDAPPTKQLYKPSVSQDTVSSQSEVCMRCQSDLFIIRFVSPSEVEFLSEVVIITQIARDRLSLCSTQVACIRLSCRYNLYFRNGPCVNSGFTLVLTIYCHCETRVWLCVDIIQQPRLRTN